MKVTISYEGDEGTAAVVEHVLRRDGSRAATLGEAVRLPSGEIAEIEKRVEVGHEIVARIERLPKKRSKPEPETGHEPPEPILDVEAAVEGDEAT